MTSILDQAVSIHAAREGGDNSSRSPVHTDWGFNPRRPRGRRRTSANACALCAWFQSTPPARAATVGDEHPVVRNGVSIHAAREGGDADKPLDDQTRNVSIHAAREGGDAPFASGLCVFACFNPRRPRGRRPCRGRLTPPAVCFNPRRPRGRRLSVGSAAIR